MPNTDAIFASLDALANDDDFDAETPLPVVEKFTSINGEGTHAGRLSAFVRLAGCNLDCSYCDTKWANKPGVKKEPMTLAQIADWVDQTGAACVTVTGGEPLIQPLLPALVGTLVQVPDRFVEIETNGSRDINEVAQMRQSLQLMAAFGNGGPFGTIGITMDYKLPSSGMEDKMHTSNFNLLLKQDVVKFVAGTRDDLERMAEVIDKYDLCSKCHVYVSPVHGQIGPAVIVDFMKEKGMKDVTLQLQLHKEIWPDQEKGV